MDNIDDPKNIAGLSNLLKDDDLESNIDLADLEREIANGASISQNEEVNIAANYKKEMEQLSRNFDINTQSNNNNDNDDLCSMKDSPLPSPARSYRARSPSPVRQQPRPSQEYSSVGKNDWNPGSFNDSQLRDMTIEEQKQDRINSVLHDIDDRELEFNIGKEKEEDDKASLLEQIDMLRITLEDDGIDVSGVPKITKTSSMKDVQNIYKILRLKNDRNRYCSFAEELILAGAYGLEYLFDGKKDWFGRNPDLTGWSDSVKVKLRRMRFETSTFVGEIMQEYNLSAGTRLALELLPSMFLYSRSRRLSQNDNLVSDDQYKDAISQLNSMN